MLQCEYVGQIVSWQCIWKVVDRILRRVPKKGRGALSAEIVSYCGRCMAAGTGVVKLSCALEEQISPLQVGCLT